VGNEEGIFKFFILVGWGSLRYWVTNLLKFVENSNLKNGKNFNLKEFKSVKNLNLKKPLTKQFKSQITVKNSNLKLPLKIQKNC
jgi:hypothetical protein